MVKVYDNNQGEEMTIYMGFKKSDAPPPGFKLLMEVGDVRGACIAASAILLLENDMTYDSPGAKEYTRDHLINFEEISHHMAAYELGKAVSKMLSDAKALCGTEAK